MKLKVVLAIVAFFIIVALFGLVKYMQVKSAIAQAMSFKMPPSAVSSLVTTEEEWVPQLKAVGSTEAVQGVIVSTDLPGIVKQIAFESGQAVKKGDLLVQLDTVQEQAQLRASEAKRQLAEVNIRRFKSLLDKRVAAQSDYDQAAAEYLQLQANSEEIKALIERKTIRAPFDGLLGIREVNVGQYLKSGDPIAPLQAMDPIYVNFSLPQQNLGVLKVGGKIKVQADGLPNEAFAGEITAINSVVDAATRNVQVQAKLSNPDGKLRPGMYVTADVQMPTNEKVIFIPSTAISYAPYGDSVFVIEEMTDPKDPKSTPYKGVRQQFVKLGPSRGDQVAITSGLKVGEEIATSGVFKLRPAAHVEIHNESLPSNEASPTPADT